MKSLKRTFKATLALVLACSMVFGIMSIIVLGTEIDLDNTEENVEDEIPPVEDDNTGEPADIVNLDFNEEPDDETGEEPDDETDGETGDDNEGSLSSGSGNEPIEEEFTKVAPASGDLLMLSAPSTISFYVDNMLVYTLDESNPQWPDNPDKFNLSFKGWYDSANNKHEDDSNIFSDIRLDAVFTATVRFLVDGIAVETLEIKEGSILNQPSDPDGGSDREFFMWLFLGSGISFPITVARNLDITALFRPVATTPDPLLYNGYYWIAGSGGTVKDYVCGAGCGWTTGNQYKTNVQFLFHPMPLPAGVSAQAAYIVITCERCGAVNFITASSNGGMTLSAKGAAPSGANNVNLAGIKASHLVRKVTFQPGANGVLVGTTIHNAIVGEPFDPAWEPTVLSNNGWVFIGWQDTQTKILHGPGATPFPSPIENRDYTFVAQYSNKSVIHIEATTASKIYNGTPLTAGYVITGLPIDHTITGFTVEGSITDAGSSISYINASGIIIRDADGVDVTGNFVAVTHQGTLTVTPRQASVTAEYAYKYIGDNDPGFTVSVKGFIGSDAPDVHQIKITRDGAGTDETIGVYPDALVASSNGYNNPNYVITWNPGDFEIKNNPLLDGRIINVTGNSLTVTYDNTSHIASGYTVEDIELLESLGFEVTAAAAGISAIDVNTS